jgi:hypothetical protein
MGNRLFAFTLTAVALISLGATPVDAQTAPEGWMVPRTADGHPDLQGIWANNAATPLERPDQLADKVTLTDEEQAGLAARAAKLFSGTGDAAFGDEIFQAALTSPDEYTSSDAGTGNYNSFWIAERDFDNRTSLIVDPPDGRIPLTAATEATRSAIDPTRSLNPDGPEETGLNVRCVSYGAPYVMAGYNSTFQIVQTSSHVAIVQEMIHDARIVPLGGQPPIPADILQYHGDSRGHWEGDTLVVETTNYRSSEGSLLAILGGGGSENRHLTERFTRVGPDAVRWAITFNDPITWTQPWTAVIMLSKSDGAIFEYACHEGNYGMEGILAGTRKLERASVASNSR